MVPAAAVRLLLFPLQGDAGLAQQLLSPEERARAARLLREADRGRYAIGRAVLRRALGGAGLEIGAREGGKPFCDAPGVKRFNLSHTGTPLGEHFGLLALADHEVGVDIEAVRPLPELAGMARLVLTQAEIAALEVVPPERRPLAFLRLWTLKEAVLKAAGFGLRHDPRALDLGALGEAPVCNRAVLLSPSERWFVSEVSIGEGLLAACSCAQPFAATLETLPDPTDWLRDPGAPSPTWRPV